MLIAGLFFFNACVIVGPPLFARGARRGSFPVMTVPGVVSVNGTTARLKIRLNSAKKILPPTGAISGALLGASEMLPATRVLCRTTSLLRA